MTSRRKWTELRDQMMDDPAQRLRVEQMKRAIVDGEKLAHLREERKGTQQAMADALEASQARVSQIERGSDLYLSTLERYVNALGGRLEIAAIFPECRITLTTDSANDAILESPAGECEEATESLGIQSA